MKEAPGGQSWRGRLEWLAGLPVIRILTRKWVYVPLVSLVSLLVVLVLLVAWYYSGVLNEEAFVIKEDEPDFAIAASLAGDGLVRLEDGPEGAEWSLPGRWGIVWEGGNGMVGEIVEQGDGFLVRRFTPVTGEPPQSFQAEVWSDLYPPDPLLFLGLEYETVQYDAPLGAQDAMRLDGAGSTWAVFVHGLREVPGEGIPTLPVLQELDMPALLITYRNDAGQPPDPSGRYQYGLTEWEDVHAAVEYALSQPGAEDVVLIANSMGGGIATKFLYESPLAARVKGVVLDSPMLDFKAPVDLGARNLNLPGFIVATVKWVATMRFGVDWEAMNYLNDVDLLAAPILLIHSEHDERIPIHTSNTLAERRPDLVTYSVYHEGGHADAWYIDSERYERELREFLLSVVR